MKTLLIAFPAAVLGSVLSMTLVGDAQGAKTPSAVAVVSANRVLVESTRGRSEAARLQSLQQQRAGELRTRQIDLEATRQQLSTTADGPGRLALQQKELQQRTDFERMTVQFQNEYQALQREVNADLLRRVKTALDDMMKTMPYQLILNSDTSVMWNGAAELDLTAAVITRLNAQP
jgi:Skp family chaperone for outer membrane proteins